MRTSKIKILLLLTVFPLWCIFPQNNISKLNRQFPQPCNREYNQIQLNNFINLKYSIDLVVPKKIQFQKQTQIFPDSIINKSNNNPISKYIFHQNGSRITQYDFFNNSQGQWTDDYRGIISYNSAGYIDSIIEKWWENGWVEYEHESFTYDSLGNNIGFMVEHIMDGSWVSSLRETNKFNSFNKLESSLEEVWNGINWENNNLNTIYYNSHGLIDSSLYEIWDNNAWENYSLTQNYKNVLGIDTTVRIKKWQDSLWENSSYYDYTYDNFGNNITILIESWDGAQWNNDTRYSYIYDSNNYYEFGKCELFQDGVWAPGDGLFFDPIWGNTFGFGSVATEQNLWYTITGITDNKSIRFDFFLSQNYPNPFNPSTIIDYTIPTDGIVQLKIYNILGEEKTTLVNEFKYKGHYSVNFNGSNFASGIYLYQIKFGNNIQIKKMIIQK